MSFPRQSARTRRFSLGVPRAFVSATTPSGPLVLFLRSDTGDDPVTHLWRHDPRTGTTTKLVDARMLDDGGELPATERARRERSREQAGGIVAYGVDDGLSVASFALAGRLYTVEVATGAVGVHPTGGPAFDPRPSPDGRLVAYHAAEGLHLLALGAGPGVPGTTRELVGEPGVSWGRSEFVAAEEMGRSRGFWWAGDGTALAVARVDESAVAAWSIADPASPWTASVQHRYPAAGTTNADVSLWVVDAVSGGRTEVTWPRDRAEYLASVTWGHDALTLLVQPRDQRSVRVLTAEPATGATRLVREWADEAWVELVPGSPAWLDGRLLTVEDRPTPGEAGTRVLCCDGVPATPAGLQVRELLSGRPHRHGLPDPGASVTGTGVVTFIASPADDPTRTDVFEVDVGDGHRGDVRSLTGHLPAGVHRLVPGREPSPYRGPASDPAPTILLSTTLERSAPRVTVVRNRPGRDGAGAHELEVVAETPVLTARPRLLELGARRLRGALLLPSDDDGRAHLPVVLDPYGGPHAQRVVRSQTAFLGSQWLADQGFAVLVVDGRGSPGRGPAWERAVHHDLAAAPLADQIEALHAAAVIEPRLDLSRVGIRGWSFGGYLAAYAVLRRPDIFHAAVAGAPVTDWTLYDTHYTERYLGHPDRHPDAYARSSLVDADGRLPGAVPWDAHRPPGLLLIHGLADDNVVAAHTLRLSSALLADGRVHAVLPLTGVTHMTPQEVVAEHLLTHQVAFLRTHLVP